MPPTNGATQARTLPLPPPSVRDLTREVAVGGSNQYVLQYARALPQWIDDVTADFGSDLYERMLYDSQVSACVTVFKASILEDGVKLAPAIDDADEDGYELATQIMDECERMWDDLNESPDDVLWALLDNVGLGNKIAEQVCEVRPRITDGKAGLQLASLKVKPRQSYLFVVDKFVNLIGILGRTPGQPGQTMGAWTIDPAKPPPNLFPSQKFAIATFRPKDNDPRGTSVLRPAYDAWWRKRQALTEYVKYLAQFAGPSIWGTTPESAQIQPPLDYLGNPVPYAAPGATDPLGNPQVVAVAPLTPEQDLLAKLQQFRNNTAAAFPYGTDLHTIEMQGEGKAFLSAIAECNMSITKAILTQTLTTEEGEHQARAAAQVHQDVLDTLVRQGKRSVVRMLAKQVFRPWVAYNWGDEAAAHLVPKVSLGTTEQTDLAPMINAIANLYQSGFLDESQKPEIDNMLNLPARDLTQGEPLAEEGGPQAGSPAPQPAGGGTPEEGSPEAPQGAPPQASQQAKQLPPDRVGVREHTRGRPTRRQAQMSEIVRKQVVYGPHGRIVRVNEFHDFA